MVSFECCSQEPWDIREVDTGAVCKGKGILSTPCRRQAVNQSERVLQVHPLPEAASLVPKQLSLRLRQEPLLLQPWLDSATMRFTSLFEGRQPFKPNQLPPSWPGLQGLHSNV